MQHSGNLGYPARTNVDHCTHRRTGTGNTAKKAGNGITHSLSNELPVGVMPRAGHVVRDQRGQQAINRAEHGENHCRLENDQQRIA